MNRVGFIWPVLERYSWLPPRALAWYQKNCKWDQRPGVRRFGVSTMLIAVKPRVAPRFTTTSGTPILSSLSPAKDPIPPEAKELTSVRTSNALLLLLTTATGTDRLLIRSAVPVPGTRTLADSRTGDLHSRIGELDVAVTVALALGGVAQRAPSRPPGVSSLPIGS